MDFDVSRTGDQLGVEADPPTKKLRGKGRGKVYQCTFGSKISAVDFLKSQKTWQSKGEINGVISFSCNINRRKNGEPTPCLAKAYLHLSPMTQEVDFLLSSNQHSHEPLAQGITELIKGKINELYDSGITKPNGILANLKRQNIEIPKKQLENYLVKYRKEKFGEQIRTFAQLLEACQQKPKLHDIKDEENPDVPVVSFEMDSEAEVFRIFFTTRRLLEFAEKSENIQADATYKLNWHGFPVLLVGNTDKDRKFHPTGLAVTTNESSGDFSFIFSQVKQGVETLSDTEYQPLTLIADMLRISSVFGDEYSRVHCWARILRLIDSDLKLVKNAES